MMLCTLRRFKKNVLCQTLTPLLGVEMRSKKINGHHIIRQNLMENPKKINRFVSIKFLFWTNYGSLKNDS